MPTDTELNLQEHSLNEILEQLQDQIRAQPAVSKHRIFLFQLLIILGQWDRALNQLNVLRDIDAQTLPMAQTYQEAIQCEGLRTQVFSGERSPLIFGDPQEWLALLVQANSLDGAGEHAKAAEVRGNAFDQAPATTGTVDGVAFEWLADADSRLGPVCEAIVDGKYYWVPFNRIAMITMEAPEDLRDQVWMPAQFTWSNGGQTVALVPTRYPGSESSEDSLIRLARKTEWNEVSEGQFHGQGQKLFTTNVDDYPLMDVRSIELNTLESGSESDG